MYVYHRDVVSMNPGSGTWSNSTVCFFRTMYIHFYALYIHFYLAQKAELFQLHNPTCSQLNMTQWRHGALTVLDIISKQIACKIIFIFGMTGERINFHFYPSLPWGWRARSVALSRQRRGHQWHVAGILGIPPSQCDIMLDPTTFCLGWQSMTTTCHKNRIRPQHFYQLGG